MTDEAHRDLIEQVDHPGVLEEAAEQDEQKDVRGRDQRRYAIDSLCTEVDLGDDLVVSESSVGEGERQVLPEQAVGEERGAHDRKREPEYAPRRLEQQHDHHRTDDEIKRGGLARALD